MEKIRNAGWFITDEEYQKLLAAFDTLKELLEDKNLTLTGDKGATIPYTPHEGIELNPPCPNCPWSNPNPNIGDWTWRPWQAPWYGPGEPVPCDWKVGDGEWWKHQPYCTSTTEDNPNTVKQTKTNGEPGECQCQCKK